MSKKEEDNSQLAVSTKNQAVELSIIEQVVLQGDLSKLNPEQRVVYYNKVCESAGLNPFTRPFEYIQLNGKLTLYAKKDCTEQLRKLNGISIDSLQGNMVDDVYVVTARAKDKTGRTDQATGAVTMGSLRGDAKANALMKAETKAKRRVTLSIAGLGWVDETEIDTIPDKRRVVVDPSTGEIHDDVVVDPPITADQVHQLELLMHGDEDGLSKLLAWANVNTLSDIKVSKYSGVKTACQRRAQKRLEEEMKQIEQKPLTEGEA